MSYWPDVPSGNTLKDRYEGIQLDAEDWNEFTTMDDVLETIEGWLGVDVFGSPTMERFARMTAHHACHQSLVVPVLD